MAYVQESTSSFGGPTVSLTGVTAGNSVIVLIVQHSSGSRTYTVADDVDGAYAEDNVFVSSNRVISHQSIHGHTGGNIAITVTQSGSAIAYRVVAIEWSNLSGGAVVIGENDDGASVNTHHCAPVGSIDTLDAALVVCGGVLTSAAGVTSTGAGATYTKIDLLNLQAFCQYKAAAAALTDDRGVWSHTGTARQGVNAMVAYPEIVGGAVGQPTMRRWGGVPHLGSGFGRRGGSW